MASTDSKGIVVSTFVSKKGKHAGEDRVGITGELGELGFLAAMFPNMRVSLTFSPAEASQIADNANSDLRGKLEEKGISASKAATRSTAKRGPKAGTKRTAAATRTRTPRVEVQVPDMDATEALIRRILAETR